MVVDVIIYISRNVMEKYILQSLVRRINEMLESDLIRITNFILDMYGITRIWEKIKVSKIKLNIFFVNSEITMRVGMILAMLRVQMKTLLLMVWKISIIHD